MKIPVQSRFSFSAKTVLISLFLGIVICNLGAIPLPIASHQDSRVNLLSGSTAEPKTTGVNLQAQGMEQATLTPDAAETSRYTPTPTPTGTETSTLTVPFQETVTSTSSVPPALLTGDFAPDEVLVRFDASTSENEIEQCLAASDATVAAVIKHEELPWLTLITCQGYNEASNTYRYRVVVRAVQVAIK